MSDEDDYRLIPSILSCVGVKICPKCGSRDIKIKGFARIECQHCGKITRF